MMIGMIANNGANLRMHKLAKPAEQKRFKKMPLVEKPNAQQQAGANVKGELANKTVTFLYRAGNPYMDALAEGMKTKGCNVIDKRISREEFAEFEEKLNGIKKEYFECEYGFDGGTIDKQKAGQFKAEYLKLTKKAFGKLSGPIVVDGTTSGCFIFGNPSTSKIQSAYELVQPVEDIEAAGAFIQLYMETIEIMVNNIKENGGIPVLHTCNITDHCYLFMAYRGYEYKHPGEGKELMKKALVKCFPDETEKSASDLIEKAIEIERITRTNYEQILTAYMIKKKFVQLGVPLIPHENLMDKLARDKKIINKDLELLNIDIAKAVIIYDHHARDSIPENVERVDINNAGDTYDGPLSAKYAYPAAIDKLAKLLADEKEQ